MYPEPRIETIGEKKLIGMHISMSHANNRTAELWSSFMPQRNTIPNKLNSDLYSLQIYPSTYSFQRFDPMASFEKWAAVEVSTHSNIPEGMEALTIPGGQYAVFTYKGNPIHAAPFFQYIFDTWLPSSEYELDARPHFEVLGAKYKNNDDASEEEVWVPVRKK